MNVSNNIEDPDNRIKKWLEQYVSFRQPIAETESKTSDHPNEDYVKMAAYYLSLEKKSYDTLCWILAEKTLKKTGLAPTENETRKKAEEIADLGKTYDELCYLNAELDILMRDI